jgi:hypothetical protein
VETVSEEHGDGGGRRTRRRETCDGDANQGATAVSVGRRGLGGDVRPAATNGDHKNYTAARQGTDVDEEEGRDRTTGIGPRPDDDRPEARSVDRG